MAGLIPRSQIKKVLALSSPLSLSSPRSGVARLLKKSRCLVLLERDNARKYRKDKTRVRSRPKIVLKSERVRKQEKGGRGKDGNQGKGERNGIELHEPRRCIGQRKNGTLCSFLSSSSFSLSPRSARPFYLCQNPSLHPRIR